MGDFKDIKLPDYTLIRRLGHGAMAQVYLAVQDRLQRQVALKIMAASLVADATFRERFLREGRVVAQLTHPNIVTIYDINVHEPYYYMAMQYADGGGTLKDKVNQGISEAAAVKVVSEIASALHYAHQRDFVHRDVKPANILFTQDNDAVLSDFGIVKSLQDGTALTQQGLTVGTPAYMSPEQILGRPVDARSDLYSLGVVLFEALTGSKPFQAEETFALAMKQVSEPVPRLPPPLTHYQDIIDCLMAKKPEQRFANGSDLIDALRQVSNATKSDSLTNVAINPGLEPLATSDRPQPLSSVNALSNSVDALSDGNGSTPANTRPAPLPNSTRSGSANSNRRWWSSPWTLAVLLAVALTVIAGVFYQPLRQRLDTVLANVSLSNFINSDPTRCEAPVLTAQQQREIAQLLEVADMHFEFDRLIYPDFSNAAYAYDQVLTLNPCEQQANRGLQNVADRLASRISSELTRGEKTQASLLSEVEAGLSWAPRHPELLKLHQQLSGSL